MAWLTPLPGRPALCRSQPLCTVRPLPSPWLLFVLHADVPWLADADIVCAKKAIHFNPTHNLGSDSASQVSGAPSTDLEAYKAAWSDIHGAQAGVMYWMVCALVP